MKVSVIGLGYVGAVVAAGLATAGHKVLGIDIDPGKVDAYRAGAVPIFEPGLRELIHDGVTRGNLRFLHNDDVFEPLGDAILVAAGTPTSESGAADLSQVGAALSWAIEKQSLGAVIIMKSTVPPGTGLRLAETELNGTTFKYVSNPEFLREGQAVNDWLHPDRIVIGGTDDEAIHTVKSLYENMRAPYVITDTTSAEMIKYACNAFLATKISFINEVAALCDRMGAKIDDVSNGVPRTGQALRRYRQ